MPPDPQTVEELEDQLEEDDESERDEESESEEDEEESALPAEPEDDEEESEEDDEDEYPGDKELAALDDKEEGKQAKPEENAEFVTRAEFERMRSELDWHRQQLQRPVTPKTATTEQGDEEVVLTKAELAERERALEQRLRANFETLADQKVAEREVESIVDRALDRHRFTAHNTRRREAVKVDVLNRLSRIPRWSEEDARRQTMLAVRDWDDPTGPTATKAKRAPVGGGGASASTGSASRNKVVDDDYDPNNPAKRESAIRRLIGRGKG